MFGTPLCAFGMHNALLARRLTAEPCTAPPVAPGMCVANTVLAIALSLAPNLGLDKFVVSGESARRLAVAADFATSDGTKIKQTASCCRLKVLS